MWYIRSDCSALIQAENGQLTRQRMTSRNHHSRSFAVVLPTSITLSEKPS